MKRLIRTGGAVIVLLACGGDRTDERPAATASSPAAGHFVDSARVDAQLVFVGTDSSALPAGLAHALFVPLSTFNVERNGIPNMFPPADRMAALLTRAGVGNGALVIVAEPIPAGRAFAALDYLGLARRTAILDGGKRALDDSTVRSAEAIDATAGAPSANHPPIMIDVRGDMLVDAAWVHDRLHDSTVVLLDARPPAEYSGAIPGTGIDRPGHIPGARNLFWQTLVRSASDSRLKPEAELRKLFDDAGVRAGSTIVAYCRTGGQSSFLYAVARHLGYDVKLYDGSYFDWSRTAYPVER